MLSRTVLPAGRRSARLAATVTLSAALLLTGSATVGAAPFDLPTGSSGIGAPAVVETPRLSSVDNFRDLAGSVNQRIAARADEVYWMAFGIPLRLK